MSIDFGLEKYKILLLVTESSVLIKNLNQNKIKIQ